MAGIVFLAFALRALVSLALAPDLQFADSEDYHSIAVSLVDGEGFRAVYGGYENSRAPTYPLLLAACRIVHPSLTLVRLVQAALDAATTLLLIGIGGVLGLDRRSRLLAGFMYAINPYAIYFSYLILSEVLFNALLVATLLVCLRWEPPRSPARRILFGLLLALTTLTRSVALGAGAILLSLEAWRNRDRRLFGLFEIGPVLGVVALVMAPWVYRNHLVYGELIPVTPHGGLVLYESMNPQADGGPRDPSHAWPEFEGRNFAQICRSQGRAAREWMRANPGRVLELALAKQARFWSPLPNFEKFRRFPYVLAGVYEAPFLFLGLAGMVLAAWRPTALRRILPVVLFFPALHLVFLGSIRYRMPIEPLLALFAALAIETWTRPRPARDPSEVS